MLEEVHSSLIAPQSEFHFFYSSLCFQHVSLLICATVEVDVYCVCSMSGIPSDGGKLTSVIVENVAAHLSQGICSKDRGQGTQLCRVEGLRAVWFTSLACLPGHRWGRRWGLVEHWGGRPGVLEPFCTSFLIVKRPSRAVSCKRCIMQEAGMVSELTPQLLVIECDILLNFLMLGDCASHLSLGL